ncbi:DNA-binding LytR/AlgR family response regulator [Aquimarina sp. EL_43]|uniref:LytR/AlgR family response regulator transcription factor n=1 Tax=Aquimarina TaxID=290174 RepID=UPI0004708D84|nr:MULTISPECIES: LytTR family DNA-binding domain-containing protein [Aquimarina]MBG6129830.1 DNA-binding LytR/AlgR family response regulator [Aquimarina sp. EL_35]MBG6150895.1 DNA-binding LytR/AlgR family response regulator [Aquimarina sp. EL_32]MBG6167798.1 DNA-binding LytR/AlgR family response regulator [Aquimarina sp. EL_43]
MNTSTTKTRCLIVDDEPLATRLIEKHISQIESLEVVASCNNALKAFEILNNETIDLLFLDVKMPSVTGIDLLKTIKHPPSTILTTAYRDYALEGYDLDIVDYILKPVTFDRFFKAVERYFRIKNGIQRDAEAPANALTSENPYIVIKSGNKHHKIHLNTILYIESLKDYIKIHTNKKCIVAKYKIGDIELELADKEFLRTHRSYIINLKKVTAFTTNDIDIDTVEIPIGVSYRDKVFPFLEKI